MDTKEIEFAQKLLALFKVEAREHLDAISSGLADMINGTVDNRKEIIEVVYREAHSLKGAARSVNNGRIVDICQSMESVFSALKSEKIGLSPDIAEKMQQVVDFCYRIVGEEEISLPDKTIMRELLSQLDGILGGGSQAKSMALSETFDQENSSVEKISLSEEPLDKPLSKDSAEGLPVPAAASLLSSNISETVRVSTEKLDALLFQAEEMISLKLAIGQRATDQRNLLKLYNLWKKKQQRAISVERKKDSSSNRLILHDPFFASLESKLSGMVRAAEYDQRMSGSMVDRLLDDIKKALMLPFSSMFDMLLRTVRDLARSAGKKVELITEGGDIEIDKRVLEEMKPALIHLIRNSIVHGIEPPEERDRKKKAQCGNITISISAKDDQIEISVADDGRGIDVVSLKASAVKIGLTTRDELEIMGEKEVLRFVFQSGTTTSPLITDISGRGLGLAIVREKVEKLNGIISIDSTVDIGTRFRMRVPLTLATFRGILIKSSEQLFVLPSSNVERVLRTTEEEVQTVENRETLVFDGKPVSLARMDEVLGLQAARGGNDKSELPMQVVVVGSSGKRMAFVVDEVLHEQEVLVKPFGRQLSRIRNISAATVLTDGKVVPILNIQDLLKSAIKMDRSNVSSTRSEQKRSGAVLVVEDSITARALLKNILEAAGYSVRTARDGIDAMTALKSSDFDIVVSDVEMPRMNGFDLTTKIRSDKKLKKVPVVLVTALESREDRVRGLDVGADAYIVKSSFDQSDLLEVIERLI